MDKAGVYADFGNGPVLDCVRQQLVRGGAVLDVGCASGGLLAAVRDLATTTTGVDLSPTSIDAASQLVDHAVVGDVTAMELPLGGPFDVIVCSDVVEHVADGTGLLRRLGEWLTPGGRVVLSLPNVAHVSARWRLLRGVWRYEASGIFDDTHLRFYTLDSALALAESAGYQVVSTSSVIPALGNHLGLVRRLPGPLRARVELFYQWMARTASPRLFAFQFVLVLRPAKARARPEQQCALGRGRGGSAEAAGKRRKRTNTP